MFDYEKAFKYASDKVLVSDALKQVIKEVGFDYKTGYIVVSKITDDLREMLMEDPSFSQALRDKDPIAKALNLGIKFIWIPEIPMHDIRMVFLGMCLADDTNPTTEELYLFSVKKQEIIHSSEKVRSEISKT